MTNPGLLVVALVIEGEYRLMNPVVTYKVNVMSYSIDLEVNCSSRYIKHRSPHESNNLMLASVTVFVGLCQGKLTFYSPTQKLAHTI